MEKIKSTAKKLDTFLKWLYYILIATTIIVIPVAIVCMVIMHFDSQLGPEVMESIGFGSLEIYFSENALPSQNFSISFFVMTMIFFVLASVTAFIMIKIFRNIFGCISSGEPFNEIVHTNLKKTGILVIVYGIISEVFSVIESTMLFKGCNIKELLVGGEVKNVMLQHQIELDFIFVAIVIFLLAYIFKYGAQLQQQVDETL